MTFELIKRHGSFGGTQSVYRHNSWATGTAMEFSVYLPPQSSREPRPIVTYLSGLTCTWANVTEKAGAQRYAAEFGLVMVCPDTSPRGLDLPGEHDAYDFGSGAGFYVDATEDPWKRHYRMATYVAEELPALIGEHFPADMSRHGIFGHSMGGHGALTLAFKHRNIYRSVSALAPIVAPSRVPWGEKAFNGYLGGDRMAWKRHDACELVSGAGWTTPILVDQGLDDEFLQTQLKPELFKDACRAAGVPLELRLHGNYDHSYYFIATFMGDHLAHHARLLNAA